MITSIVYMVMCFVLSVFAAVVFIIAGMLFEDKERRPAGVALGVGTAALAFALFLRP